MGLFIPSMAALPPAIRRPIVIIGTGGIASDAHLPAYVGAGLPVAGVFDLNAERAQAVAAQFGVKAFSTFDDAIAVPQAIFDLATPPQAHLDVLARLPVGACALIQKPLGRTLEEATAILNLVRQRSQNAAVNFQLRSSQMARTIAKAIADGRIGELTDLEVHLNIYTPWQMFPFLSGLERMEITNHSIHYLDLIRHLAGEPAGVFARTLHFPGSGMAQTRTTAILDYGAVLRCTLSINHEHNFGRRFQCAAIRIEGTKGAALANLGVLLDYPSGEPDTLWFSDRGSCEWQQCELPEQWFPHAFASSMINLQRFVAGADPALVSSIEDAWQTMAVVEACYEANSSAGVPPAPLPQ